MDRGIQPSLRYLISHQKVDLLYATHNRLKKTEYRIKRIHVAKLKSTDSVVHLRNVLKALTGNMPLMMMGTFI